MKCVNDPFQGPSEYQVCHLVAHKRKFPTTKPEVRAGTINLRTQRAEGMALLPQAPILSELLDA